MKHSMSIAAAVGFFGFGYVKLMIESLGLLFAFLQMLIGILLFFAIYMLEEKYGRKY